MTAERGSTRGIIFDMDGVLVDSGAHHRAAWRALLEEVGATPPQADYWRLTIGRPAEEAVGLLLGRSLSEAEARRLARRKRDHYVKLAGRDTPAVPGAREFVGEVARRGIPCAVATSASRHDVSRLLRGLGLIQHFSVIVTAEDVSWGKPDPEVYLLAARGIRQTPERCLVFEDSLVGVQAARRAGMRVIGLASAHTDEELRAAGAERVIPNFEAVTWPL
ncbi:MAG: HAD family phosphatase [Candidatus Rokubacteria bacterium]|nr:HAD family phosphatase [Candidatus Rokubacteria bacterium]